MLITRRSGVRSSLWPLLFINLLIIIIYTAGVCICICFPQSFCPSPHILPRMCLYIAPMQHKATQSGVFAPQCVSVCHVGIPHRKWLNRSIHARGGKNPSRTKRGMSHATRSRDASWIDCWGCRPRNLASRAGRWKGIWGNDLNYQSKKLFQIIHTNLGVAQEAAELVLI